MKNFFGKYYFLFLRFLIMLVILRDLKYTKKGFFENQFYSFFLHDAIANTTNESASNKGKKKRSLIRSQKSGMFFLIHLWLKEKNGNLNLLLKKKYYPQMKNYKQLLLYTKGKIAMTKERKYFDLFFREKFWGENIMALFGWRLFKGYPKK